MARENVNSVLKHRLKTGTKNIVEIAIQQQKTKRYVPREKFLIGLITANSTTNNNNNNRNIEDNDNKSNSNNIICAALKTATNMLPEQHVQDAAENTKLQAINLHERIRFEITNNKSMIKTNEELFVQEQLTNEETASPGELEIMVQENEQKSEQDVNNTSEITADDASKFNIAVNNSTCHERTKLARSTVVQRNSATRPIQRRRIRRKAQSTVDDQAEHLTEMSVRGLDLFRYASIKEGVYQCTECAKENIQKTFKNKYSFQRHAFLYHEGKHRKVFPCTICGKEFSRPDKMKNHMKMTHDNMGVKDLRKFNAFNYLMTAASSNDLQSMLFPQTTNVNINQREVQQDTENAHEITNFTCAVKNEIGISPSSSPPPTTSSMTSVRQLQTQRLEEVK